jgi:hypothetical protein
MNSFTNIRVLVAAFFVALLFTGNAYAQATATGTANANATIAKPITITKTSDLNFGIIVPDGLGNGTLTVTVDTADGRSIANNTDGALLGGTVSSAAFTVTGRPNATYAITLPVAAIDITGGVTGDTMPVGSFTSATANGGTLVDPGTGTGSDAITVGATLTVGEEQAADSYTGTFNVTVAYN